MADTLIGGAYVSITDSTLQAQASIACLFALRWSIDATLRHVTILTDCKTPVEMLLHQDSINIQLCWTVREIRRLGSSWDWCSIQKVSRQQVQRAHDLATAGTSTSISFSNLPYFSLCLAGVKERIKNNDYNITFRLCFPESDS